MMAPEDHGFLGQPSKRQKLTHTIRDVGSSINRNTDRTAYDAEQLNESQALPTDLPLNFKSYIPAGCIRVHKDSGQISSELWSSLDHWLAFSTPPDSYKQTSIPFLPNLAQDQLLKTSCLRRYALLVQWGVIRAEFKTNDSLRGQVRVFLPEDQKLRQGDADKIHKTTKKGLKELLRNLDISRSTWLGEWTNDVPISHVDSFLDVRDEDTRDESLLELFNALPSPQPKHDLLENMFARESMTQLLCGEVPGLQTTMYPYQRRSAALMVQRETLPGLVIDPRLTKLMDQQGNEWFCDPENLIFSRHPRMYDAPRGGILAENMGLGKTLICLGLILATKAQPTTIPPENSTGLIPVRKTVGSLLNMAAAALGRHGMPWKDEFSLAEEIGYEYSRVKEAIVSQPGHYFITPPSSGRPSRFLQFEPEKVLLSTCTLIVVPANLLQQWLNEVHKHTTGLKVLVLKDSRTEVPPATELIDYDILLFTKGRFDREAKSGQINRTPLRSVHFKRLIYDEGHTFGSASNSSQTESFTLVNALQISARWIVSGTPSQGLYSTGASGSSTPIPHAGVGQSVPMSNKDFTERINPRHSEDKIFIEQERKDLIRLGNIAMHFLKVRPWSHSPDGDLAIWQHYALQPRHGEKSHGNPACLRTTLEGMMIRHCLADVDTDVRLPPLYESVVSLKPCLQNKFALNIFNLMIITNAITSERKDADYFFHPKQVKNLQALVTNLRQASFFWSGFEIEHLKGTISIAQKFLDDALIPTSLEDVALLRQAIEYAEIIISNGIFQQITEWHEMPMYVENNWPEIIRSQLSLDTQVDNPTLLAPCMLFDSQKYIHKSAHPTPQRMVVEAHQTLLSSVKSPQNARIGSSKERNDQPAQPVPTALPGPKLAGGVTVGQDYSPRKLSRPAKQASAISIAESDLEALKLFEAKLLTEDSGSEKANLGPIFATADRSSPDTRSSQSSNDVLLAEKLRGIGGILANSKIISTASTKLSYLLDRIIQYQAEEKILVFYEDSNTAYYIAQYLECLNVKHLIYAKELTPEKRSRYVATFNTTSKFRVLLMDVSQAAFGLDVSSASRVFFINPVFSPQIEAQAVKRAHRIGQTKPVYVETLVLQGSIEEVLVARRNVVSKEEHQKLKSILDDQTVYDWIRNVKMLPMEIGSVSGPEQMAPLQYPQMAFEKGSGSGYGQDPDAEIVQIGHDGSLPKRPAPQNQESHSASWNEFRN